MRKRIRIVMFIVAASFIIGFLLVPNLDQVWRALTGRGGPRARNPQGYIGQVGKHNITPEEYRATVDYMTDKYKTDNRLRDLSNEDYRAVEQQAWRFLVDRLKWARVFKAANISVTTDEVLEVIKDNPPAGVRELPQLQTDGKFDQQKYLQYIQAPENREFFTKYFREILDLLPKEKIRVDAISVYRPTGPEVEDALDDANTRWKITDLYFGAEALKEPIEPTEAEARAWYDAHKEDFRTRGMWQLRYVVFPLVSTKQDSDDAKATIDRAYTQLLKGETFNNTMLDYSDFEGESLSTWAARSQFDRTTDSIVSRLKPGTYSAPFPVPYGWQIVLLDSLKKDSIVFRRVVVRVKMGSEALATMRDSVRSFIEQTAREKFDTVAARFGLTIQKARPLVGGQDLLPGLDIESPNQLIDWAKNAKVGQVMDQPVSGAKGYYVFDLAKREPPGIMPFDKRAQQGASWRVQLERKKQAWAAMAKQAVEAIKAGKSLEQYAQENPGVQLETDSFNGIMDCRQRKGPDAAGAIKALNPGEIYGPVETDWGAFVIRCDGRTTTGTKTAQSFVDERRTKVAQDLLDQLLKEPEVRDFRDAMAY